MTEIIFSLFVFSLLFGVYLQWKLVSILKNEYKKVWLSIGEPHFLNNSIKTAFKLHKFIWKKHYGNHPLILTYGKFLKAYQIAYLILLPTIMAIYVLAII